MSTEILLQGIVGSTAYGLAGPESDIDRLGIFVRPTIELVGMVVPDETIVHTNPDVMLHEAGKYVKLALNCNPTVMELMWLPRRLLTLTTDLGAQLIEIRVAFLSASRVRNAYLGYATAQLRRLGRTGAFESTHRARTEKHARHVYRLLWQGYHLYSTGELIIELPDPQRFHAFGKLAAEDPECVEDTLRVYEQKFDACSTPLPTLPNVATVADWLRQVRKAYW